MMKSESWKKLAAYDEALRASHGPIICGVDETGRGSWASVLAGGAVILPAGVELIGLNDSKMLSEPQREALFDEIKEKALGWAVEFVTAEEIDSKGLTWANVTAMVRAAEKALTMAQSEALEPISVDMYVVDQSPCKKLNPHIMMPKADSTSLSVAAASVLAKVTRDRLMKNLAKKYPDYGLEEHKGYINAVHIAAVKAHGLVKGLHRFSYKVTGVNKPVQTSMLDLMEE